MEKKYLMLIPLAIPLFFGGKAAVTAIKKRNRIKSDTGNGESGTNNLRELTSNKESIKSDEHINELRDAGKNKENPFKDKQILTGPKGGKYYINESGKKIYLKS